MVGKAVRVVVFMIMLWIIILFHLYEASPGGLTATGYVPPSCSPHGPHPAADCMAVNEAKPKT